MRELTERESENKMKGKYLSNWVRNKLLTSFDKSKYNIKEIENCTSKRAFKTFL